MGNCFSLKASSGRAPVGRLSSPPPEQVAGFSSPPAATGHGQAQALQPRSNSGADAANRPREPLTRSLEDVRASCDPHRMGLVAGKKLALKVQDPDGSGRPVPGLEALAKMLYVMSFDRKAATGEGTGMDVASAAFATRIFAAAAEQVAPLSRHSCAILSVATALKDCRHITVIREPNRTSAGKLEQNFTINSRLDAHDAAAALQKLRIGEHSFFLITNCDFAVSHMVGLSMTKIADDLARVSFVNPIIQAAGRFVDVPTDRIEQGMATFFSGEIFKDVCEKFDITSAKSTSEIPTQSESSAIFTEWMKTLAPGRPLSNDYFDGRPLLQQRQKGGSCTVEAMFALMATTLPRDAYKLTKAACLSTVLAMGQATKLVDPAQQARIEERMDSAWRGMGSVPQLGKFQRA